MYSLEEPHQIQTTEETEERYSKDTAGYVSCTKTMLQALQTTFTETCSWETILAISCVIAVSVDPFFFYLPIIQEETKCLRMDKSLRTTTLILRAITDLSLIVNIIFQITIANRMVIDKIRRGKTMRYVSKYGTHRYDRDIISNTKSMYWFAWELAQELPWRSILIDFLAVLPIPQVLIGTMFKLGSSTYLDRRKTIDLFLLAQYLPRIYRMHSSTTNLRRTKGIWIRGAFYFYLYILASHVLGAFWYFFSIQRETSCWHQTCLKQRIIGCNFFCDEGVSSRNMTFVNSLDEFCLVDVPANATTPFDFGIFLDSLVSGNTGKVNFQRKFLYSFWWGLRNLSNFGTNLETSTYEWENCFAILISIVGMLLFLYLIGNVQSFILMKNEIAEEKRKRLLLMVMDTQIWMDRNGLPKEMKITIRNAVKQHFEKIKEPDMEGLYLILPAETRKDVKRFLCMEILRKVPFPLCCTESISHKVLTSICDFLKPVIYQENTFVFRMGEPLDRLLFITQGSGWTYNKEGTSATSLEEGAYYGEELLSWASSSPDSLRTVPKLQANLKCHAKIEGFVLMAKDLKVVVDRHKIYWGVSNSPERRLAAIQIIGKAVRQFQRQRWNPGRRALGYM